MLSTASARWQQPQGGHLKYNVYAFFFEQLNRTCIGMCIQDEDATYVLEKTMSITPMCTMSIKTHLCTFFVHNLLLCPRAQLMKQLAKKIHRIIVNTKYIIVTITLYEHFVTTHQNDMKIIIHNLLLNKWYVSPFKTHSYNSFS
jgi:hypothetical protein